MDEPVFNSEERAKDAGAPKSMQPGTSSGPRDSESQIRTPDTQVQAVSAKSKLENENWLSVLQWLCATVVIAVFVITFLMQAFQIPSESMERTLLVGDYLLVDKVHFASPGVWEHLLPYVSIQRGDIVVFRYPVHAAQHFVKRVIAVPGDRVHLHNGRVYVNGQLVDDQAYAEHNSHRYDSYRDDFPSSAYSTDVNSTWWIQMHRWVKDGELVVPADQYFVLGDNRDRSLDSRYWGFVPRENIIGRPLVIYWSMKQPDGALADAANGKLSHLVYTFTHLLENARWNRSMRVVH